MNDRLSNANTEARILHQQSAVELPDVLSQVKLLCTELKSIRDKLNDYVPSSRQTVPEPLLSVEQVADWLNVSVRTVEKLIAEKKLAPIQVSGVRRFTRESVDSFLRQNAGRTQRKRRRS